MENDDFAASQLDFIGKVLCVFSHEINNQLSVLKESIGLIGDLVELKKTSRKDLENMMTIIGSARNQISRTAYLCNNLNSFGHGMGTAPSNFDLNKSVEELLALSNRIAVQKRITLEKDLQPGMPQVQGNPLKIQFLIFYLIEKNLLRLEPNGSILFRTSLSGNQVEISVIPQGKFTDSAEKEGCACDTLQAIANYSGATLSGQTTDGTLKVTLPAFFPSMNSQKERTR